MSERVKVSSTSYGALCLLILYERLARREPCRPYIFYNIFYSGKTSKKCGNKRRHLINCDLCFGQFVFAMINTFYVAHVSRCLRCVIVTEEDRRFDRNVGLTFVCIFCCFYKEIFFSRLTSRTSFV